MTPTAVPRRERLAFAAGDAGFNFVWQTIELYLLFYYVRVLGLTPGQAAGVFLAGGMVDLLCDPLIGALVDRLRGRIQARAWMLVAGPPLGFALGLAFLAPPLGGSCALVFVAATHMLMRVCYSLGNLPYATLTARITDQPAEQVRLTATRMQGAALGGLIAAAIYYLLPLSRQAWGVPLGAIVLGIAAQPLFLLTWLGVKERVVPAQEPLGLGRQLAGFGLLLRRSGLLRRLLGLIFFAGLAATGFNKGLLFVFDRLEAREWGYASAMVPSLALFAGAPLWARLARRLGRVAVLQLTSALLLGAIAAAWLLDPDLIAVAALFCLAMFVSAGVSTMFWSLVPGVIQALEVHLAAEGCAARVYGLANLARKLGQTLAPQVLALSLALPGASVLPGMAASALLAMVAAMLCVPRRGELRSARLESQT
jgi:Na+/melibiose symporter-like transporter